MKFYIWLIRYRLQLAFVFLALALWVQFSAGFWPAFVLYLLFVILGVTHFLFGPLRLIQTHIEKGELDKAERVLQSIRYPNLLYKPIRSIYYTVKGSIAMAKQDFSAAEANMHKSLDLGLPMKEAEGANKLQLGMLALQRGDLKKAETLLKQSLSDGVPDADSKAMALLQLSSLSANKRSFRQAKEFFRRAKQTPARSEEVKAHIKQLERYISRLPG